MKNTIPSIAILCLLATGLAGQVSQKLSFGMYVAANYSYRTIYGDDGSGQLNSFDIPEMGKMGSSVGLTVGYAVSADLQFRTGLGYSNLGYATEKKELIIGSCITQMQTDPTLACDDFVKFRYGFHFVRVPLGFRYRVSKSGLFLQSGLGLDFLLERKETRRLKEAGELRVTQKRIEFEGNSDPIIFAAFNLGFGKTWQLGQSSSFCLRPDFCYLPRAIEYPLGPGRNLFAASLFCEIDF